MIVEKTLEKIRIVLIYNLWGASNLLKVANLLDEEFGDVFNGSRAVLSEAESAPSDMPRIFFKSEDEDKVLEIGPKMALLKINNSSDLESAIEIIRQLVQFSLEEFGWTISRLGIQTGTKVVLDQSAISFLESNYISKNVQEDAKVTELNCLAREKWNDEQVNHWINLIADDDEKEPLLMVEVDRNITSDPDREMCISDINDFFENSREAISDSINKVLKQS